MRLRGWLVLLVAFAVLFGGTYYMIARAPHGKRLTNAPIGPDGNVAMTPVDLAFAASQVVGYPVSTDLYSLARMLQSEGGSDGNLARTMRGWVVYNDAKSLGWSITRLVTFSNDENKNGRYGEQSGRRYSTAHDPYEGDLKDAAALMQAFASGPQGDPTNGATKFTDGIEPPPAWISEGYVAERRDDARSGFIIYRKVKGVFS